MIETLFKIDENVFVLKKKHFSNFADVVCDSFHGSHQSSKQKLSPTNETQLAELYSSQPHASSSGLTLIFCRGDAAELAVLIL